VQFQVERAGGLLAGDLDREAGSVSDHGLPASLVILNRFAVRLMRDLRIGRAPTAGSMP
jgi:hypothetical protein